jgi:hypothetical protein
LYAIDVNSPSFYTFQAGVNYTMGGNSTSAWEIFVYSKN